MSTSTVNVQHQRLKGLHIIELYGLIPSGGLLVKSELDPTFFAVAVTVKSPVVCKKRK